ncbi:protein tyrosine phosphatase [Pseudomonas putida S11]|nr:protein tyrosine phosphatase [Pseudomonas putida S11]
MRGNTLKALFLCTANRCRSILSQADFNHQAPVEMKAFSGGRQL